MALLLWLRSNRKKPLHRLFNALKPDHEKADEEKPSPRIHILQKPNSLKILLIQWKTGGLKARPRFLPMRASYYSKMTISSNFLRAKEPLFGESLAQKHRVSPNNPMNPV